VVIALLLLACNNSGALDPADGAAGDDGAADDGAGGSDDGGSDDGGSGAGGSDDGGSGDEALPRMSDRRLLNRLSLDLRGVRPTVEEIERLEADPAEIDALMEEFLYDERFHLRVMDLFSEVYRTRSEGYVISAIDFGLDDDAAFLEALGDEPLQILGYIADNDLPYTDLVTADWTMANEVLGQAWPVDYPAGETGWQRVEYTDGRPGAGVISSSSMWWRYTTTESNENRGRANAISRILLCNDYLSRPIEFAGGLDISDQDALQNALKTNDACIACHVTLDPLSSYFYGFWSLLDGSVVDATIYHPERELFWQQYSQVAPGYYGDNAGGTLEELGYSIAGDARFPSCAVEQAYSLLMSREIDLEDTDHLNRHREAFLQRLTVRDLFRSVVSDELYQAGDTDADGAVPTKLATADLLATQVFDLTGFDWRTNGFSMLGTDRDGLRTLAGGTDGQTVTRHSEVANPTMVLVQERVAEAASAYAVENERQQDPAERRLFTALDDLSETASDDPEAFVAQVQALHLALFGARVDADGPEVEANRALWEELYAADGEPAAAWTGLLTALMRDPDFILY
jgi:hypothetical protein